MVEIPEPSAWAQRAGREDGETTRATAALTRFAVSGGSPGWRHFRDPITVLAADDPSEVQSVLDEVDRYTREGKWCVGFVAYEAAPAFDPALSTRAALPGQPLAWFSVHDAAHPVDVPTTHHAVRAADSPAQQDADRVAGASASTVTRHAADNANDAPPPYAASRLAGAPPTQPANGVSTGPWQLPERQGYLRSLQRIQEKIADGNTYQVNYTAQLSARLHDSTERSSARPHDSTERSSARPHDSTERSSARLHDSTEQVSAQLQGSAEKPSAEQLSARPHGAAEQLFTELYRRQPTDFAAYLDLGEYAVVSVSPELFFERRGSGVTMRPMKGTVARGETREQDETNKRWLLSSAKNRAENTMIVDLLRNDLGRLALIGTVRVDELMRLETYPTFHALTSTISADVGDADLADLFAALFPCGSITGAPKASTMRIITELETEPRGVYCGAIGVVAPGGDATFSVAIRTVVVGPDDVVRYGVGSGITADSDPAEEYAELLTKARIVLDLPGADLLETFRIEGGAAVNIDRHLARLRSSARELGYRLDESALRSTVRDLCAQYGTGTWRARLLLARDGRSRAEAAPFEATPERMTARICPAPVDSADLRLRHKLSDRATYDSRRDPSVDTTLLVNERGEITEFLFGNVVIRRDGCLLTPPLGSGLLPGVGRALAIESGVHERLVHVHELADCDAVWHVNSLRGWTPIVLQRDPREVGYAGARPAHRIGGAPNRDTDNHQRT